MRSRRLALCALAVGLALSTPACKRHTTARTSADDAAAPGLAPVVRLGDPKNAGQLVSGFYDIEAHAWRWSKRQFSILLGTPKGAADRGAVLVLNVAVTPELLRDQKSVSLTASINGNSFPPETWSAPGQYVFQRPVPQEMLNAVAVRVDFELDHAIPPNEKDARELGIVVSRAALELK